ncbi:hypothetical protein [Streptomyces jeddahensis]|uniref:Tat pathway signal sequence domain protein n=1 Tax=Streptomyces jeddahensis TaxID=1716141 RepID=A0A177HHN1_9ACTN|nr:hypothetical protein [Streptomyces jeddahensis]OAH10099.1 hypothetical protein STSP_66060 [Streptomyces jeddahensis]
MEKISRRAVLAGAATATIALSLPASAACAKPAKEKEKEKEQALATSDCGELGSMQACVTARQVQDVSGIQYDISNGGNEPASYTVWYVDVNGGPESGRHTVSVDSGESAVGYFYGDLGHCFTLHVCSAAEGEEEQCLVLGPVCAEYPSDW